MQTEQQTNLTTEQEIRLRLVTSLIKSDQFANSVYLTIVASRYVDFIMNGNAKEFPENFKMEMENILKEQKTIARFHSIIQFVLAITTITLIIILKK